jgi:2-(1,2-epoxy-1,2-dihydrophenyl)acetyl-CoA isomerase
MAFVRKELDGALGIVTLDDPATLNAMTPDLMGDLAEAVRDLSGRSDVRCLILTGAGRGFCSGQNLKAFSSLGQDLAEGGVRLYWPAMEALRTCPVPVVVAVNGVAAGGGFSLAMAGDVIVAAQSARFIQVFSRIGLVPDLGSTWLMPRLVGRQRALEAMLLNEPISAETARQWGLVREVFDDGVLMDGAKALARRIAAGPHKALAATRRLIEESERATFAEQFRRELEVQATLVQGDDAREGRQAFLEKRPARFSER